MISEELGLKLELADLDKLGQARRVVVTKDTTTIVDGGGRPDDVQGRVEQIRKEVADLTVLATEKVTRKSLTPEDHRRLIQDALGEVDFSALEGSRR